MPADPQCLASCLGKHFQHFRLDSHEPRAASVLSHGNYRLLPWQNNKSLNKEHNTDELSELSHFTATHPPFPTSSLPSSYPVSFNFFFSFVLCCWFIFLTTQRLHCVCPKWSIQSEAPSAEWSSLVACMYTSLCFTPRRYPLLHGPSALSLSTLFSVFLQSLYPSFLGSVTLIIF